MAGRFFLVLIIITIFSSFQGERKKKPKLPAEFVFVQGGTFSVINDDDDYSYHSLKDTIRRRSVRSFYMSKFEVTNKQYKDFLFAVKSILSSEEQLQVTVDTAAWEREPYNYLTGNYSAGRLYFRHPGFNEYPVVNVSYEGAQRYCRWLQEKVQAENKGFLITISLPDSIQWRYANAPFIYPRRSISLIDEKGKKGYNYRYVDQSLIKTNPANGNAEVGEFYWNSTPFIIMPVKSYKPTEYGLYNMCGNVAEMVSEEGFCAGGSWNDYGGDVIKYTLSKYSEPSPVLGFRPVIIVAEKNESQ